MSRFKYAPEQMTAVLLACRSQGMGVRKAAQHYAVPRSTLNDKLLGRSPEVRKCGPGTFLTTQVEFLRIVPIIMLYNIMVTGFVVARIVDATLGLGACLTAYNDYTIIIII